jgi:hypothetical protein
MTFVAMAVAASTNTASIGQTERIGNVSVESIRIRTSRKMTTEGYTVPMVGSDLVF